MVGIAKGWLVRTENTLPDITLGSKRTQPRESARLLILVVSPTVNKCLVPCRFIPEGLQPCGPDWYNCKTNIIASTIPTFISEQHSFPYLKLFSYSQLLLGALRAVSGFVRVREEGAAGL